MSTGVQVAVRGDAAEYLKNHPEDRQKLLAAATSFRQFLNYWRFRDQRTGEVKILGEVLWPSQEEFVRVAMTHPWVYYLKARKLGETTIETAWDGWVARFRDVNARVHLFSRRDEAAQEILREVIFGLSGLPEWMQLPVARQNSHEYELKAGPVDRRLIKAYPADNDTAVEATCTHGHVDEWQRMGNPRRVWQAIEPSMAGSCHIVTTGMGPANFGSEYWRKCLSGDTRHYACFIGALSRPDRDEAWLRAMRKELPELEFRREYALSWEDALFGGGDYVFNPEEIEGAARDARGLMSAEEGKKLVVQPRRYVKAWDIGRHQDAAVGIVLDVTENVHDVVGYYRLRGVPYPELQWKIEQVHAEYPGPTAIEKNGPGEAVMENLKLPQEQLIGYQTSGSSKPRMIANLQVVLQNEQLKWNPEQCPQLNSEMQGYMIPDDAVIQDSVMALAIAEECSSKAFLTGRVMGVIQV